VRDGPSFCIILDDMNNSLMFQPIGHSRLGAQSAITLMAFLLLAVALQGAPSAEAQHHVFFENPRGNLACIYHNGDTGILRLAGRNEGNIVNPRRLFRRFRNRFQTFRARWSHSQIVSSRQRLRRSRLLRQNRRFARQCMRNDAVPPGSVHGFTNFTPSPETMVVFVSYSDGNDSTCTAHSASDFEDPFNPLVSATIKPCKTIEKGKAVFNGLGNNRPDWLLLKRGDEWEEHLGGVSKSGQSASEMALISYYGTSPKRPLLKSSGGTAFSICCGFHANLALVGLEFYSYTRDPASPHFDENSGSSTGIRRFGSGGNLLIEDCKFSFFRTNVLQTGDTRAENIKFHRNIVVDNYSSSSHSQGIYAHNVDGLIITENVFDHNGWNPNVSGANETIFNHNLYIQNGNTAVEVKGNVIARASSHGLQLRPGGVAQDNLFLKNALHMFISKEGGVVRNNVALDGKDIANHPRGMGFSVHKTPETVMEGNIVAHKISEDTGSGYAYSINGDGGSHDEDVDNYTTIFRNNIAYNWRGSGLQMPSATYTNMLIRIRNNALQNIATSGRPIHHRYLFSTDTFKYQNNEYWSALTDPATLFRADVMPHQNVYYSIDEWILHANDSGSVAKEVSFVNPERDIASYQTSIGGVPSLEAFLQEARQQSRFNWRDAYSAYAVNQYIREGFERY